eukprot:2507209-Pleurochrysis_carterae.AAC.2
MSSMMHVTGNLRPMSHRKRLGLARTAATARSRRCAAFRRLSSAYPACPPGCPTRTHVRGCPHRFT